MLERYPAVSSFSASICRSSIMSVRMGRRDTNISESSGFESISKKTLFLYLIVSVSSVMKSDKHPFFRSINSASPSSSSIYWLNFSELAPEI